MATWTCRRTFDPDLDDWFVLRDGVMVGRVNRDVLHSLLTKSEQWHWTVFTAPQRAGCACSLQDALNMIRKNVAS
jgi:hypothetical protein